MKERRSIGENILQNCYTIFVFIRNNVILRNSIMEN